MRNSSVSGIIAATALVFAGCAPVPQKQVAAKTVAPKPDMAECLVSDSLLHEAMVAQNLNQMVSTASYAAMRCNQAADAFKAEAAAEITAAGRRRKARLGADAAMLGDGYGRVSHGSANYVVRETRTGLLLIRKGSKAFLAEASRYADEIKTRRIGATG